jgi:transposase-like protein
MTMKNGRRKFAGQEKMVILRRHLVDKIPVSDVCDQAGIHPTLFYRWQKELFEHGAAAFERRGDDGRQRRVENRQKRQLEEKLAGLEQKLTNKDEVIAEIMESHVRLKKSPGET